MYNDCARRTVAQELLRDELIASGFKFWPRKVGIGAAIGHAVDAGATYLLRAKMEGSPAVNATSEDVGILAFRKEIAGGVEYDKSITPNAQTAEKQIARMVQVYATQVLPNVEPESVQLEMSADVGDGFILVGHWDLREVSGRLHDTKTGQDVYPTGAQFGGYALLGTAHGLPITSAVVDYIERAAITKPQPPAVQIEYDVVQCKKEAARTISRIKAQVAEFRKSRDIESIPSNPMSALCANKYCTVRNTEFCKSWR